MPEEKKDTPDGARVIDCDAQADAARPGFRLGGKVYQLPKITVATMEAHEKIERDPEKDPSGTGTLLKRVSVLLGVKEDELKGCDVRAIAQAWKAATDYIYGTEEEDPTQS